LGAVTIQSNQPSAFDENDITLLQGIADSLATALDNARLFGQVQENLSEIQELQRQYTLQAWEDAAASGELTYQYENPYLVTDQADVQNYEIQLKLRGQPIGKLNIESSHVMTEQEAALAEDIANEAAIALENARLVNEIQLRSQQERLIGQITMKAQGSLDVDTVMRNSIQELGRNLSAQKVQIRLGNTLPEANPGGNGNGAEGRS
jgi:GAF domain-containing protein